MAKESEGLTNLTKSRVRVAAFPAQVPFARSFRGYCQITISDVLDTFRALLETNGTDANE
jgi:hypothetical protein